MVAFKLAIDQYQEKHWGDNFSEPIHTSRKIRTAEAAISRYENSRIERTQAIQVRSAFQRARAYEADSEAYLRGVAERMSQLSNEEFEDWLYHYQPSQAISC